MDNLTTEKYPSPERAVIGNIDSHIDTLRSSIKSMHDRLPEAVRESLYDEPTYSADILLDLELSPQSPIPWDIVSDTYALIETHNIRDEFTKTLSPLEQKMFAPVPDFSLARAIKDTYRDIKIDSEHPLHDEEVVSLRDYGIACQAYYSRKNGATGDPVPGVKPDVYVRRSLAESIQQLNALLAQPEVTRYFGHEVEVFVDEGWRDPALQQHLFDTVIPNLIRKELIAEGLDKELSPEDFEALVITERNKKIARPPTNKDDSPSPHATAAAFDFAIREKQETRGIVSSVNIPMGRGVAEMVKRTDPDHFEHVMPENIDQRIAQQNRRAQHALLGAIGLEQNPTEFWHASKGDQLSSIVTGKTPYYGWANHGEGDNERN